MGMLGPFLVLLSGCAGADAGEEGAEAVRAGTRVVLSSESWRGVVHDNTSNREGSGSGWIPLAHSAYPEHSLFRGVGLNFEHIFNGMAADHSRSMFTPRNDPCELVAHSARSASLVWRASESAWGVDCELRYTLAEANAIDMEFRATFTQNHFGLGYAAMMWASYMSRSRGRDIHFYGMDGDREGWVTFGETTDDGFETGTIACHGVPPLPYEEGAQTLNVIEHPAKKFLLPFYYGLADGDGKLDTPDDTMAYIMMFDQAESIRFAMWNFIRDANGQPDPHSPAWDWQFVVRNPEPGTTCGYRARLLYKPFMSAEDVRAEYERWARGLGEASPAPR